MNKEHQYWLYSHKYASSEELFETLSSIAQNNQKISINILLIETQEDLKNELLEPISDEFKVSFRNEFPVLSIEVQKTPRDDSEEPQVVKAVLCEYPNYPSVYAVISDCTKTEFKEVLTRLIDKHFPTISKLYLTNNEIRAIFQKMEQETGLTAMIKSAIGRRRLKGNTDGSGKKTQQTYTNQPYKTVFSDIDGDNQWLDYVKYELGRYEEYEGSDKQFFHIKASGIISRSCFFSCKMDFRHLKDVVLEQALKFIWPKTEHVKLSVQTAENRKPEPLMVRFEYNIFEKKSMNRQYVEAITDMEYCSVSEYHANPYLHLSLLDYLDGSSYDIWVLSMDKIAIIPEFKASKASMGRLLNHIFERISEGRVERYSETGSIERG